MYIRIMSAFRLAKVKKIAPTPRLSTGKLVLDQDTLQAVLANRYEVMARYGKALKRAYRQELAHLKEVGAREKYQLMRGARNWFHKEEAGLNEPQKQAVAANLRGQPEADARTSNCATDSRRCGSARMLRANNCSCSCRTGVIARNKAVSRRCRILRCAFVAMPDRTSPQVRDIR